MGLAGLRDCDRGCCICDSVSDFGNNVSRCFYIWFIFSCANFVCHINRLYKLYNSKVCEDSGNPLLGYESLPFHWPKAHHVTCQYRRVKMCLATNNIMLLRYCNLAMVWKIADRSSELSESGLNMKANLAIEWWNNYWSRLSQTVLICQCLANQLFASAEIIDLLATDKSGMRNYQFVLCSLRQQYEV